MLLQATEGQGLEDSNRITSRIKRMFHVGNWEQYIILKPAINKTLLMHGFNQILMMVVLLFLLIDWRFNCFNNTLNTSSNHIDLIIFPNTNNITKMTLFL